MRLAALALVPPLVLSLASPAQASSASYTPSTCPPPPESSSCELAHLVVRGDTSRNVLEVVVTGDTAVVRDRAAKVDALAGCTAQSDGSVVCAAGPRLTIRAGGGDDRVRWSGVRARVFGGPGDDVLEGGGELRGGPGADTIRGASSADDLSGGPGRDRVSGGGGDDILLDTVDSRRDGASPGQKPEADRLDGGAGVDLVDFNGRREALVVDLAASPQVAGAKGERNRVSRVEFATGGRGDDLLRLRPVPRLFRPREADALRDLVFLQAGSGDDRITLTGRISHGVDAGVGDDVLHGSNSADELLGDEGNDVIDGRGGNDDISDYHGSDVISGGAGNDRIEAEDTFGRGRDRVDCGLGRDYAEVDRRTDTWERCERVRHTLAGD